MINLSFNPSFSNYTGIQKKEVPKPPAGLSGLLTTDTVSFTSHRNRKTEKKNEYLVGKYTPYDLESKKNERNGRNEYVAPVKKVEKQRKRLTGVISDTEYKSMLKEPLVSTPRPTFEKDLRKVRGLVSYDDAKLRIASLSRYLKEDMVGFVVPSYTVENEKKGGYQWFERSAEYLLRGAKEGVQPEDYKGVAKSLYGLLAVHDNYWKSSEFINYLSTLKQSPAIVATISAVKELKNAQMPQDVAFTGELTTKMFGYFSPIKVIDKLLKDGCAYSGVNMYAPNIPEEKQKRQELGNNPSLDHIMPKDWGGPCDDSNYILATSKFNGLRGNIGLISFLKGDVDMD